MKNRAKPEEIEECEPQSSGETECNFDKVHWVCWQQFSLKIKNSVGYCGGTDCKILCIQTKINKYLHRIFLPRPSTAQPAVTIMCLKMGIFLQYFIKIFQI